jgi:uncharacterized membrane protein
MAFCDNCGTRIQDGAKFCPSCGNATGAANLQTRQGTGAIPPMPPQYAEMGDAEANKGMAIIAYILFFIPLLTGAHNTSPFVKYHTNQGTVLFLAGLAYGVAYGILSIILVFIPIIGWLLIALLPFAPLVLGVIGIVNAAGGKMKPLPVIGGFSLVK